MITRIFMMVIMLITVMLLGGCGAGTAEDNPNSAVDTEGAFQAQPTNYKITTTHYNSGNPEYVTVRMSCELGFIKYSMREGMVDNIEYRAYGSNEYYILDPVSETGIWILTRDQDEGFMDDDYYWALSDYYGLPLTQWEKKAEHEKVAGRRASVYNGDMFRGSLGKTEVWIDEEYGFPLKYVEQGQTIIEVSEFQVGDTVLDSRVNINIDKYLIAGERAKGKESELLAQANLALGYLKDRDFEKLATLVSRDKGVLFSPYAYVRSTDRDDGGYVILTADQLKTLSPADKYVWGSFDGSGDPINMTVREYFERFVCNRDYLQAPRVAIDKFLQTGNSLYNLDEAFPGANFVEYNFPGPGTGGDWDSLRLVFEKTEGQWVLVGVVHDQWTI